MTPGGSVLAFEKEAAGSGRHAEYLEVVARHERPGNDRRLPVREDRKRRVLRCRKTFEPTYRCTHRYEILVGQARGRESLFRHGPKGDAHQFRLVLHRWKRTKN